MPRLRPGLFFRIAFIAAICLAALLLLGTGLLSVGAAPPGQFPTNSVRIISDPPPPDLPGQFSEATRLRPDLLDPDPFWRSPTFDDSGWRDSYPVIRQAGWGQPVGNPPPTDFVWGGPPGPGPDGAGRFEIVDNPAPQFLFLRKNFCIPLNAALDSIAAAGPLTLQAAASPGRASVYYNGSPIVTGLPGDESGASSTLDLTGPVDAARRVGRNTLAMRLRDDVADASAGVAYEATFNYTIDGNALVLPPNPPTTVNTPVTFRQINNGLSGDGPFTFTWELGNGLTSTAAAPAVAYPAPGVYTITLTMTDRFGCPSAPVTVKQEVVAQAQVRFSQATYTVVEDQGAAVITVILETPSPLPVTVDYATAAGTATAGSDYTPVSGTLTFPPGVESQTFSIPIVADGVDEPDETVDLMLSNPVNAVILAPNPAAVIITDMAAPAGGKDDDDDDDDDDEELRPPPPPPPAAVAPQPSPAPTEAAGMPVTLLPETGLVERPADTNAVSPWSPAGAGRALTVGLGGLLGAVAGYFIIRRSKRRNR